MTKNGWQINYSEVYEKFQVSANGVVSDMVIIEGTRCSLHRIK